MSAAAPRPPAPRPARPSPTRKSSATSTSSGPRAAPSRTTAQIQCRQTHHFCHHVVPAQHEFCPLPVIRFQDWAIPFTILYEGGPDRESTESRVYTQVFGDQAACVIRDDGQIDCWSDFRRGDPRQNVPERFRASEPTTAQGYAQDHAQD